MATGSPDHVVYFAPPIFSFLRLEVPLQRIERSRRIAEQIAVIGLIPAEPAVAAARILSLQDEDRKGLAEWPALPPP